jgi:5-formyltetrahydrofolate cyclo-ligase
MRSLLRATTGPPPDLVPPLAAWLNAHPGLKIVAAFAPLPGEPDLLPLTTNFPSIRWCFPKITENGNMSFHAVDNPLRNLRPGAFGILEPGSEDPEMPIDRIDAFLCPGLAFDRQGGRLGRGRGFYDKALSAARSDALKIGACFACQIVATTFPEAHDAPMDELVCEDGWITLAAAPA